MVYKSICIEVSQRNYQFNKTSERLLLLAPFATCADMSGSTGARRVYAFPARPSHTAPRIIAGINRFQLLLQKKKVFKYLYAINLDNSVDCGLFLCVLKYGGQE